MKKESIKVNLSNVFLIIIIILLCFVITYLIFKNNELRNNENILQNTDIITGNTSIISENNIVNNNNNNTSNNKNNTSNNKNNTSNNKNNIISDSISNINAVDNNTNRQHNNILDSEAEKCIQNYLDLLGTFYGDTESMLTKLGIDTNNSKQLDDNLIKTNIKYSSFKEKIYDYMTERCFNSDSKFKDYFTEKDGYLCYIFRGATGAIYTLKSYTINNSKYIAQVVFEQEESKTDCTFEFELVKNNGKVVIDYCKQTK